MTMKVPGVKRPIKTTLLTDATRVHADWYKPISPPSAPTPPNWGRWLYVPSLELGNAIALTLDIDPACLSSRKHLIPDDFKTRLVVAIEHLRPRGMLSEFAGEARQDSIVVTLQAVAKLANFCRWTLPPEFPKPELVPARTDAEPMQEEAQHLDTGIATISPASRPVQKRLRDFVREAVDQVAVFCDQNEIAFDRKSMPGDAGDLLWLLGKLHPDKFKDMKAKPFQAHYQGVCSWPRPAGHQEGARSLYLRAFPELRRHLAGATHIRK